MMMVALAALLQAASPSMKTLDRGATSQIESARQATARTQAEWVALWRSHAGDRPAPSVDWSTSMVAAIFLGTRPTAGWNVEIVRTREDSGRMVVEYVEKRPGRDTIAAQVLTSPFHIVAVPQFSGDVKFAPVEK